MKKIIILFSIVMLNTFSFAQTQQQKIDSVGQLVKKYFNEKNPEQLYNLGGERFRKALSPDVFKQICENNLFPLGEIKEMVFEKFENGVNKYKAVFNTVNLTMYLSLDSSDKFEVFLFQPYKNENAKKNYAVPSTNKLITKLDKQVDSAVQSYISLQNTVGLSIAVLKDGKIYFYGYGETAKGNHKIPDEKTIFEIGSISKTFTATLLADAINKGKINLDDAINKYLPDSIPQLQFQGIPITIKTLANHSSGLPRMPDNFVGNDIDSNNPYKNYDDKKLFEFYKNFKPIRKPGEKYEYSNLAFGTLGVILERVNKKPYQELLIEKICAPLAMNDTREFIQKSDSARFASGYNENGEYNSHWDFIALIGAGGIRSTAADMIKFAKANLGDAPETLKKDFQLTHEKSFSDGENNVALGWHYIKPANDELLFHNGGTGGFHSYLAINLQKKFAVILLSNSAISCDDAGNNLMKMLEAK